MASIEPTSNTTVEELRPKDLAPARTLSERLAAVWAFCALVVVDAVTRVGGFHRLREWVSQTPRRGHNENLQTVVKVCSAVDRAAAYYFKKAWCLQRSATTTILLRWAGVDAEMVIGVEKIPFYAHAWVEVRGRVVNDHPMVQKRYAVLDRC